MFLDPQVRAWYADWPAVARSTVAALRAAAVDDPVLRTLVDDLSRESDTFRDLWARHDVRPTRDETKQFNHPLVGPFAMRRHVLRVGDSDGQVIIAYQPRTGDRVAIEALERLRDGPLAGRLDQVRAP